MARNQREAAEPAAEVEAVEAVETTETTEAAEPAAEKQRFVVKTNRLFGYEVGQVVEFDKGAVSPEWLQHLQPTE